MVRSNVGWPCAGSTWTRARIPKRPSRLVVALRSLHRLRRIVIAQLSWPMPTANDLCPSNLRWVELAKVMPSQAGEVFKSMLTPSVVADSKRQLPQVCVPSEQASVIPVHRLPHWLLVQVICVLGGPGSQQTPPQGG